MGAVVRIVGDVAGDVAGDVVDVVGDVAGDVVDVVGDVAGDVVDVVGDAFEWVGETVVDAAEWTYDTILEPVVAVGEGIIQGAIDDPLGTAIMIAAASTGNPFIIAAAAAARTAINGGSVEDMLISAGTSYLGAEVGSYVGDYIGSAVTTELGSSAGTIATQAASGATRGAITAAATGESIEDAALQGAINGAISGGTRVAGSYVRGQISPIEATSSGATNIAADPDSFNSTFRTTYSSVSSELGSLVDGFDDLPDVIQDTITSGAAAAITSYIETGEVNEDLVAAQMFNAAVTTQLVQSATANSDLFDPETIEGRTRAAFLARATNGAVSAAFTGADPSMILPNAFTATALASLNEQINETTGGGLLRAIDEITGLQEAFDSAFGNAEDIGDDLEAVGADLVASRERGDLLTAEVEANANAVDAYVQNGQTLINRANDLQGQRSRADVELDVLYERKDQLDSLGSSGTWSAEYQAEYDTLINDINSQVATVNSLNTQYNEAISAANAWTEANGTSQAPKGEYARLSAAFKSSMDALEAEIETQNSLAELWTETNAAYNTAVNSVSEAGDALVRNERYIDDLITPVTDAAQKAVVDTITANRDTGEVQFNADEYREMYGLSADENPYTHWLNSGRTNYISEAQRETARNGALQQAAYAQVISNPDALGSEEQLNELANNIFAGMSDQQVAALGATPDNVRAAIVGMAEELGITADNVRAEYDVTRDTGVTDADIASGRARIDFVDTDYIDRVNELTGKVGINFSLTPKLSSTPVFNPRLNMYVLPIYDESGRVAYLDPTTKEPIQGVLDASLDESGIATWNSTTIEIGALAAPPTLLELSKINPVVAIDAAGNLNLNEQAMSELDWASRQLVRFAVGANKLVKSMDAAYDEMDLTEEQKADAKYNNQLLVGAVLDAGGGLLNAFNGVSAFMRDSRYNPVDPRSTNLGRASQAIMQIGTATQPEEYNAAITELRKSFADAKGFWGTVDAIYEGATTRPFEFAVEFIGKEVIQELPILLASGGVGTGVRLGAQGVSRVSQQIASRMGSAAAWTTNAGLQVLETAGGTAAETYAELYDEAIRMGVSPDRAAEIAQDGAIANGVTAAIIEGTLGRILDPGDVLASRIGGGKVNFGKVLDGIATKSAAVGAEGLSEGIEETASTYLKIAMLAELNPAIVQEGGRYADMGNALAQSSVLGALAGTGTASTMVVGDAIYEAIDSGTYTGGDAEIPVDYWGTRPAALPVTDDATANAVITFNPTVNTAFNNTQSEDPAVRAAAETELQNALGWQQYFDETGAVVDLSQDADRVGAYNVASNILNAANDNAYTTPGEVRDAYGSIADITPIQLSDAELLGYTGQRSDENLAQDLRNTVNREYVKDLLIAAELPSTDADVTAAIDAAFEQYGLAPDTVLDTGIGDRLAFEYNPAQAVTSIIQRQLGRQGRTVTEADIDAVTGIIAAQDAATEPLVYTAEQLGYDVNQDGVIDIKDQNALQQLRGQQTTGIYADIAPDISQESQFAPTGVYAALAQQQAQNARQRQRSNFQQLMGMLQVAEGPKLAVEGPDIPGIEYYYNPYEAESIFATPKQAGIFGSELAGDNQNSANDDFLSQLRRATGGI